MSYLIVSPHLDDAVLSCGQLMAAYPGCTVVTVFAGFPQCGKDISTDYDEQSGWRDATEAVSGRRREDVRALTVLDALPIHLDGIDNQYEHLSLLDETAKDDLFSVLDETTRPIMFPLGIQHPDHERVSDWCMSFVRKQRRDAYVYEELPGRVLWPTPVENMLTAPNHALRVGLTDELVAGPMELKEAAVACYRSQRWAMQRMSMPSCFVPERYWRLTW